MFLIDFTIWQITNLSKNRQSIGLDSTYSYSYCIIPNIALDQYNVYQLVDVQP